MLNDFEMGKDFEKLANRMKLAEANIDNLFAWARKDVATSNYNDGLFWSNLKRIRKGALLIGIGSLGLHVLFLVHDKQIEALEKRVSELEKNATFEEKQDKTV